MENLRKRTMMSDGGIDYSKQYLTIVSLANNNTIGWSCNSNSTSYRRYIYVSTDEGTTWTAKRSNTGAVTLATLNNGGRLLVKYYNNAVYATSAYFNYFTSTQDFNVEGNIMSMTTNGSFENAKTVSNYAFKDLFYNCEKLKSAENLALPATTLGTYCYQYMFCGCTGMTKGPKTLPATTAASYCYSYMFSGCGALTQVPDLPAKTLATNCYEYMFQNCRSLTSVQSELPAMTLSNYCYQYMYYGCSNITTAPLLPASTLVSNCYSNMFYNCSKLNRITCLATSVSASSCKYQWVSGVASSGTFTKNPNITTSTWSRGVSGIPTNWTVNDYKFDISQATVTVADQKYTGSALTPTVTVTLNGSTVASSNYTVAYSDNTNVGTATVTVTGTGNYEGQATGHFEIVMQQTGVVSFSIDHVDKEEGDTGFTYAATKNGDGALTYSSSNSDIATVNISTGLVTLVGYGTATITATMAETVRYTGASDSYTVTVTPSFAVGETKSFSYTGSVQSVGLPPGTYQLQVWGAQGGSGYDHDGGKGGYSTGVLTVSEIKTLYVFVGGQGSRQGNGGWNGGGGGSGYSSYNANDEYGQSYFGCGGGSTDFALKSSDMSYFSYRTGRSSESLLSRIIVAGGGSGGAWGSKEITTTTTYWETIGTIPGGQANEATGTFNGHSYKIKNFLRNGRYYYQADLEADWNPFEVGDYIRITWSGSGTSKYVILHWTDLVSQIEIIVDSVNGNQITYTHNYSSVPFSGGCYRMQVSQTNAEFTGTLTVEKQVSSSSTSTYSDTQSGYVGGGTTGRGYSSAYYGKQNGAGSNGGFGYGANQTTSNYRYCGACGGGGWYGGGNTYSDDPLATIERSGGGSGFVNTSASAGNRPSGYTGLQLDSGTTYDGTSSFPAPSGGNETGHAGNGYAKITRTA